MSSAMTNFLIAVGITSGICYALMSHVQNRRRRRSRACAGGGDSYSGSSDGFAPGNRFSGDQSSREGSSDPSDGCSCSFSSDNGGGGDCGGGGDGGGGGD